MRFVKLRSEYEKEAVMLRKIVFFALLGLVSCSKSDPVIVVGSKNFTESVLLGELLAQQIEHRTDLRVERRLNLGGTFLCHQALRSGKIDLYPEYTGTALTAILKRPVEQDPNKVFETVSLAYRQEFAAQWLQPFGFNNTFAIVVRPEEALQTISDLAAVSKDRTIGFNFEFLERQDGYPGLVARYGLSFAGEPKTMDLGLLYRALRGGQIDVAVGNSTDGLIAAWNLRVLEDDLRYFPPYDAAPVVRIETLERHPKLRDALAQLGDLLSENEMQGLNHEIDGRNRAVAQVVQELRAEKGL